MLPNLTAISHVHRRAIFFPPFHLTAVTSGADAMGTLNYRACGAFAFLSTLQSQILVEISANTAPITVIRAYVTAPMVISTGANMCHWERK